MRSIQGRAILLKSMMFSCSPPNPVTSKFTCISEFAPYSVKIYPPWSNTFRLHTHTLPRLMLICINTFMQFFWCLSYFLQGHNVYLSPWNLLLFDPSYGSRGNKRWLWWVWKRMTVPFQGICLRWGCPRAIKQRNASVLIHQRASYFHW